MMRDKYLVGNDIKKNLNNRSYGIMSLWIYKGEINFLNH